jgi:uncharacterized protein with ParB-like and HNH nuclease domain
MNETKSLIELFGKEFQIPNYQRGYRWEKQEVTELLDDLWSFWKTSKSGEFYCLQSIVLQKADGFYNVLDGQQRLTTLYLILVYLEERRFEDGYDQKLFSINYATRPKCEEFIKQKKFISEPANESNIDFYHICNAYASIHEWFNDSNHRGAKGKLLPILLDDNAIGNRNIRFIWYEVENDVNPIKVFISLNVGKIPLTDAELIKALLLQKDEYSSEELKYIEMRLFKIASEWDTIEYTLQNEEFWQFISNDINEKPTHIEFILDLIADEIQKEKNYFDEKPLKHATFLILSKYLQDLIDTDRMSRIKAVEKIWGLVTVYSEYFKEWFYNRKLFHFIGYLISVNRDNIVDTLLIEARESSKFSFIEYLKDEIGEVIKINKILTDYNGNECKVELEDLKYEDDKSKIHNILLLHNVLATLNSEKEKARFPFNLYKKTKHNEKWSLEHIHAQNSEDITKHENRVTWLNDHVKSLSNINKIDFKELIQRMKEVQCKEEIKDDVFDQIISDVYIMESKYSGINEQNKHAIDNLCLLDKNTNSQLNNSMFDVKREKMKKRELDGYYLPICTRNVFLKAYTEYPPNNAYWTDKDRKDYLKSIQKTYNYFIKTDIKTG